ncbi:hypothetical protein [Streptomyces thermolilacinus]|uniref:Uncharacterized protein n=1 Tax=Streptomyces thermolilacinus SPC6 TaxID=1306406 RepID=A0A1D3DPS4_9ACTN|nr:hypothetical protein [Streptomyces thermolilacinus]OEJ94321.1 hypothetical protein J116_007395 [Streptomyces thermolilacinus SPC6]
MTEHIRRAPRPLADSVLFVLWWAWAWQSSGATAQGATLIGQLRDDTPWWWWVILVGLLCGLPAQSHAPGGGVARLVRRVAGGRGGAPVAVALTLAALVAPALLFGVGLGSVVSDLPTAARWDGFLDVMSSAPALAVYAAGSGAVLLRRRSTGGRSAPAPGEARRR